MTDWCPISEETLSAFIDGELSPRHRRRLACHIADCPICSRQLGSLYAMKSYVASPEQVTASFPAELGTRIRQALDTVDRVAHSLPHLGPRPVAAWRLPALVAVGVVLIVGALYSRQLLVTRPAPMEVLFQAHYQAVRQLVPTHLGLGRYEAVPTSAGERPWRPVKTALLRLNGGLGQQQVYRLGRAVLSQFSLPEQSFQPDAMFRLYQGRRLFYISAGANLSMVAWRQPDGWGILVADMYPEQLLPLADGFLHSPDFPSGF